VRIVRCQVATVAAPFPRPLRFAAAPMTTNTAVVVHLEEADGAIGFGYAPTFNFGTGALMSFVAEDFAPSLLHVELQTTQEAVATMRRVAAIAGRLSGTARLAIGVLEMALLDVEAKLAGLALHRFWGKPPTSIRAYASGGWRHLDREQLVAFVVDATDQGFDTVKLQVGLSPDEDAARLRAVREVVGPDVGLMLDANQQLPAAEVERWIDVFAPFDPVWLEEPVAAEDHGLLVRLKDAAPFAIAAGESETEEQLLRELLERPALDVIQPDAYRVGLTAMREVCDRAHLQGVTTAPHMAHEVSAHVLSGQSDEGWLEYFDWFNDWWEDPVVPVGGRVTPLSLPGHGLKLKQGWLEEHLSASPVTVSGSTGDGRVHSGDDLHREYTRGV
jgi:L-alanine-DL-glutamate epimerase-like enolase superfamily enzyme